MSENTLEFDFAHINLALTELGALCEAAEAHGIICGFICAGFERDETDWIEPILVTDDDPEEALSTRSGQALQALFDYSFRQLQSFEFDLMLLIPADDASLKGRSEAIGTWCQGLLTGLAMAEPGIRENAPVELQETLNDLTKITLIDYDDPQNNEENEVAYAEVVEYVRMATLLIHSILNTPHSGSMNEETTTDRIH